MLIYGRGRGVGATVVIPAQNEGATIASDVARIGELGEGYRVLVVDDGSVEDSAVLARSAGAEVIFHPCKKGYRAALKTGIGRADSEAVVFFDAGGRYEGGDSSHGRDAQGIRHGCG